MDEDELANAILKPAELVQCEPGLVKRLIADLRRTVDVRPALAGVAVPGTHLSTRSPQPAWIISPYNSIVEYVDLTQRDVNMWSPKRSKLQRRGLQPSQNSLEKGLFSLFEGTKKALKRCRVVTFSLGRGYQRREKSPKVLQKGLRIGFSLGRTRQKTATT